MISMTLKGGMQVLVFALAATMSAVTLSASKSEEAIKARLQPVGQVCVEGDECAVQLASNSAGSGSAAGRSGESIYKASCFGCHGTGAAGAPKFGDAAAWEPRLTNGRDALTQSAIKGKGAMPPRGFCADCSDDEIRATVEYILDNSK